MAIYSPKTFANVQNETPILLGTTISAEGQAMVSDTVAGRSGVKIAAGAGGEIFAGFTRVQTSAAPFLESSAVKVEEVTLPGSGVYQLAQIPLANTILVYNLTDAAAIAGGSVAVSGSGVVTVTGGANKAVRIIYKHALTINQFRSRRGDVQPGGFVGQGRGTVSVMKQGVIYTDQFDTAVSWEDATGVKLAAGGLVTNQAGSGVAINANIVQIPTLQFPWLGLSFLAV